MAKELSEEESKKLAYLLLTGHWRQDMNHDLHFTWLYRDDGVQLLYSLSEAWNIQRAEDGI
jgi:hypothetical protein